MTTPWTEDKDKTLIEMWPNYSASIIGEALGGFTRNAVIGRARRLGLQKKGGFVTKHPVISKPYRTKRVIIREEAAAVVAVGKEFKDLALRECHYPLDPLWCGLPVVGNKPYCAVHAALCLVKPAERKK